MYYVDANVFIWGITSNGNDGIAARYFLRTLSVERPAYTSYLTLDEVAWEIRGELGREAALRAARGMLDTPHLHLLDVNHEVAHEALHLMEEFNLDPRDAFHAATMRVNELRKLVSGDADFDRVPGIKRIDVTSLKE